MRLSDDQIARARSRVDIYAKATTLKRSGAWWVAKCPLHDDAKPSFAVRDGYWTCFAGCGHGDPIDFLRRWRNLSFEEAVKELTDGAPIKMPPRAARQDDPAQRPHDDSLAAVQEILRGCGPITERSTAHLYLWSRGLPTRQPGLLAHEAVYCVERKAKLPAVIAPITNSQGEVTALQRIWCKPRIGSEEKDSRADLEDRKKTLGHCGNGMVRLAAVGEVLGVAEGVETGIAASVLYGLPVWVACGLSRLGSPEPQRAPSVWIPPSIRRLVVFGDNGAAGHRVADFAAWWWCRQGLAASAVYPDSRFDDFATELVT